MNRLKRPQLSLSELKVPPVLRDLYWDLRDRRLLPLVALLAVAMLALPFLLGGGDGEAADSTLAPLPSESAQESASLTVLPAAPGLREPSKRLAGRSAKNPFRQHYTGPVLRPGAAPLPENAGAVTSPAEVSGGETPSTGGGSPVETGPAPEPAPVGPGDAGSGGGSSPPGPGEVQLYTFAIDVKVAHTEVTESGTKKMGEPVTMKEVEPATSLPGKKTPVLTYLNVDMKGKKALLLVSTEVTALYGDNRCAAGTGTCQLLALEEGVPEVVEYGDKGARYRFELLKIKPIEGPTVEAPKE